MLWQYHPQEIVWRPSSSASSEGAARLAEALHAHRPTGLVRHGAAFPSIAAPGGLHGLLVANGTGTSLALQGHPDLPLQRALLRSCDLVVAEGRIDSSCPWIVELDADGRGLEEIPLEQRGNVAALVGECAPRAELPPGGVPRFRPDDIGELAEHVLDHLETRARERPLVGVLLASPSDASEARSSAAGALVQRCPRMIAVDAPDPGMPGLESIPSAHPGWGDAGRILSAFEALPEVSLLVLDASSEHVSRLDRLLEGRDGLAAATAYRSRDTHMPDPGASVWEPRAREWLSAMLAAGTACTRRTLVQAPTRLLEP